MNKIKKGNLNYDQSGRAYPDNPRLKENWDCIWKYGDKYYELVGDDQHKEWEEVNIYDQIIDEVYEDYLNNFVAPVCPPTLDVQPDFDEPLSKETFIKLIKHSRGFSEKWGLKIEERELSLEERRKLAKYDSEFVSPMTVESWDRNNIPTKLITITYNNETIDVYEPIR